MGSDESLLARYADRADAEAFAVLVARHLPAVRAVARRTLSAAGESGSADDVAQSVFVLLSRKPPALVPGRSLAGWLHRTSHLMARDAAKGVIRRRRREAAYAATRPVVSDPRDNSSDLAASVDAELDRLPDGQRQALLLRFFSDLPTAEVARTLGVPLGTAEKRLTRGLTALRQRLGPAAATPSALLVPIPADLAGVPEATAATVAAATSPAVPTPVSPGGPALTRWTAIGLATAAVIVTAVLLWSSTPTPSTTPASPTSATAALTQRESDALLEQAIAANEATARDYRTLSYLVRRRPADDGKGGPPYDLRWYIDGEKLRLEQTFVRSTDSRTRDVQLWRDNIQVRTFERYVRFFPTSGHLIEAIADAEGNFARFQVGPLRAMPRPDASLFGEGRTPLRRMIDQARSAPGGSVIARSVREGDRELLELTIVEPGDGRGSFARRVLHLDPGRGSLIVASDALDDLGRWSKERVTLTSHPSPSGPRWFPSRIETENGWPPAKSGAKPEVNRHLLTVHEVSFNRPPASLFEFASLPFREGMLLSRRGFTDASETHLAFIGGRFVDRFSPEGQAYENANPGWWYRMFNSRPG